MFSSSPDYRRFADSALQRLRNDPDQKTSNRISGMLLNLVLLSGLWGVPLYARWIVLSDRNQLQHLSEDVLGKWRCGDTSYLEFTPNRQLRLIGKESIVESADYQVVGDVLQVFGFKLQPGDRDLELNQQCYRISIRGGELAVTAADKGFTPIAENMQWEKSDLRKVLPPWQGPIIRFQRADDR